MNEPRRGEIWWVEIEDVRDIPTELRLGPRDGMLDPSRLAEACQALRSAADCRGR